MAGNLGLNVLLNESAPPPNIHHPAYEKYTMMNIIQCEIKNTLALRKCYFLRFFGGHIHIFYFEATGALVLDFW